MDGSKFLKQTWLNCTTSTRKKNKSLKLEFPTLSLISYVLLKDSIKLLHLLYVTVSFYQSKYVQKN